MRLGGSFRSEYVKRVEWFFVDGAVASLPWQP